MGNVVSLVKQTLMRQLIRRHGDEAIIGAGTVLTSEQAKLCLDSRAAFLVSHGLSPSILSTARACDRLAIPGALTPTELMNARELGAKLKYPPITCLGKPDALLSLNVVPKIQLR